MKRILLALLISLLSCGLAVADVDTIDGQAVASGEGVSCTDTTKEDFHTAPETMRGVGMETMRTPLLENGQQQHHTTFVS
jgi:hypothetical protein